MWSRSTAGTRWSASHSSDQGLCLVPPAGFEPAHPPPEAGHPRRLGLLRRDRPSRPVALTSSTAATTVGSFHQPFHGAAATCQQRPRIDPWRRVGSRATRGQFQAASTRRRWPGCEVTARSAGWPTPRRLGLAHADDSAMDQCMFMRGVVFVVAGSRLQRLATSKLGRPSAAPLRMPPGEAPAQLPTVGKIDLHPRRPA